MPFSLWLISLSTMPSKSTHVIASASMFLQNLVPFYDWVVWNGNAQQCSCLENPRDAGAWWAAVYGIAQSRTRLKWLSSSSSSISLCMYVCVCVYIYIYYIYIYIPEKAMAPHSSTLAWKIPWMEEPGRLQSMGSLRVRHDWATSLSPFTFMHWRRKWQPTLVFLPGESQGWLSLVGCCLWGRTESDTTEAT